MRFLGECVSASFLFLWAFGFHYMPKNLVNSCHWIVGTIQKPHKHNLVALNLALYALTATYTFKGKEMNNEDNVLNPMKYPFHLLIH